MRRPSFQFYPGDWQSNTNLRRCSHAEKGIWLDVMCLLHDSEEYGVLRWALKEIAQAVGCKLADLKALVTKGVLKGADAGAPCEAFIYVPRSGRKDGAPVTLIATQEGPIWYSSRMVRDEYVRTIRGESSRFGEGNDAASKGDAKHGKGVAPKDAPKPPFGDGSSTASSSSPSDDSVPDGTGGEPPAKAKSPEELAKAELWRAAVSVLEQGGCPPSQCRTFMGKLVQDYTFPIVKDAVAAAVAEQPADAREYLKACCQRLKGERKAPNRQEALEANNRAVAERLAAELEGAAQ
ncbi:hypothetical protein [Cupriavidus numazuensis]|uniref:Uncharacterized protein n=1 Tax=Cupriavidus numazuensis TaxID=221992 RepID=A0ABN7PWT7_9BURK|nr:hypothetical protein [Cupriavidus numazuensis]CAG2132340.1 hypothetical protein LMG26411_00600 [Cupriavidus numazuensis]